jgi:putative addiction module antidote
MKLEIISIDNSIGVILPKELLDRMNVETGDMLYVSETPTGFEVSPNDPDLADYRKAAQIIMRDNRDALRRLAGHDE